MCGCGRPSTGAPAASSTARPASPMADLRPFVVLKYRGARALLVRGPVTGVGYACYPGQMIRASPLDAAHLVASGAFARARL